MTELGSEICAIPQFYLLAQNSSILQALLEVRSNGLTSHIFNPAPQLVLLRQVVLLYNL